MKRIAIEKMDGTKFNAIATTEFDYAKDSKWLYAHGFRYTNAVYNEKAGREPKAMFHVNEAKFAEKFPKEYAGLPNQLVISNYRETDKNNMCFGPYEARVYRFPPRR